MILIIILDNHVVITSYFKFFACDYSFYPNIIIIDASIIPVLQIENKEKACEICLNIIFAFKKFTGEMVIYVIIMYVSIKTIENLNNNKLQSTTY